MIDGFSKTYGMPGWRLGFAHGPSAIIREMIKLQQYSFVCAPQPAQWAGAVALDVDMSAQVAAYRRKRDLWSPACADDYELVAARRGLLRLSPAPLGHAAWSLSPGRSSSYQLLMIPGSVFSCRDTHFRISYAAPDAVIDRGIEALRKLAKEVGLRA